jgi:hypothetical protein
MAVKYSKWYKIYQHCPFQGPPKFTEIGIFGLKKTTIWQSWWSERTLKMWVWLSGEMRCYHQVDQMGL